MSRCIVKTKNEDRQVVVGLEIPNLGGRWFIQVFQRDADGRFDDDPILNMETISHNELLAKMREWGADETDPRTKRVMSDIQGDLDPGPSFFLEAREAGPSG